MNKFNLTDQFEDNENLGSIINTKRTGSNQSIIDIGKKK
jgi:hypothetical protein